MGCIHIGLFKPAIVVDVQFAFCVRFINCRLGGGHEGASLEHDALFNGFVDIAGQGRDQSAANTARMTRTTISSTRVTPLFGWNHRTGP